MREDRNQPELSCARLQCELRSEPRSGLTSAQLHHLSTCVECMELLIVRGVENAPAQDIPAGFAAKVCAVLPMVKEPSRSPSKRRLSGENFALVLLLLLCCVGSVTYATHPWNLSAQGASGIVLAVTLLVETASFALWLGLRNSSN